MNVLILDTNFSSMPIYESLIEKNHKVFLMGGNENDFLSKNCKGFIKNNYSDFQSIKKYISQNNIDHLIPGCNDVSYEACTSFEGEEFTKNIETINNNNTLNNKKKFRIFCKENNIRSPHLFENSQEFKKNMHLVIKPTDSFSGKGISIVNSSHIKKLKNSIAEAKKNSKSNEYILEEYIKGQLYSYSAFIENFEANLGFAVQEHCFTNPYAVDTSFYIKNFNKKIEAKILLEIKKISQLLQLKDGLIHLQIIVDRHGDFYIIEITRRCPGDLYSKLIELSTSIKYSEIYTNYFLGNKNPEPKKIKKRNILRHTITQNETGIFKSIEFNKSIKIKEYIQTAAVGDLLRPSPQGRIGILFIEYKNKKEKEILIRKMMNKSLYKINLTK